MNGVAKYKATLDNPRSTSEIVTVEVRHAAEAIHAAEARRDMHRNDWINLALTNEDVLRDHIGRRNEDEDWTMPSNDARTFQYRSLAVNYGFIVPAS